MAVKGSSLKVPPPKTDDVYVLGIAGLPPQCNNRFGWQIVKDLVRVVLEHHELIERNGKAKPGMVHMSTSTTEVREAHDNDSGIDHNDKEDANNDKKSLHPTSKKATTEIITAHVNMKSSVAAWHAWSTIDGNRLWGYRLTAAVFPDPMEDDENRGKAWEPRNWQKAHDLADRFAISTPGGACIWSHAPDGKITKIEVEGAKTKKSQVKGSYPKRPGHMKRLGSEISSCSTLMDDKPPPYQGPIITDGSGDVSGDDSGDGSYEQSPSWGWARDWHGHLIPYQQTLWDQTYEITHVFRPEMYAIMQETPIEEDKFPTMEDVMARERMGY